MKRRVGFENFYMSGILYLAHFPLLLSFQESNILIKTFIVGMFQEVRGEQGIQL